MSLALDAAKSPIVGIALSSRPSRDLGPQHLNADLLSFLLQQDLSEATGATRTSRTVIGVPAARTTIVYTPSGTLAAACPVVSRATTSPAKSCTSYGTASDS